MGWASNESALQQAVREQPEADEPLAVLEDFLEELDDPRLPFVRLERVLNRTLRRLRAALRVDEYTPVVLKTDANADGFPAPIPFALNALVDAQDDLAEQVGDGRKLVALAAAQAARDAARSIYNRTIQPAELFQQWERVLAADPFDSPYLAGETITSLEQLGACAATAAHLKHQDLAAQLVEMTGQVGPDGLILVDTEVVSDRTVSVLLDYVGSHFPLWNEEVNGGLGVAEEFENTVENVTVLIASQKLWATDLAELAARVESESHYPVVCICPGVALEMTGGVDVSQWPEMLTVLSYATVKPPLSSSLRLQALFVHGDPDGPRVVYDQRQEETIEDIAQRLGATVLPEWQPQGESGMEYRVGHCERLSYSRTIVQIENTNAAPSNAYRESIRQALWSADSRAEREWHQQRLSRLYGDLGCVRVAGGTESEARSLRELVQSTVYAIRSCIESGFVQGGGVAWFAVADSVREQMDDTAAARFIASGLEAPLRCLADAAGYCSQQLIASLRENGYNATAWQDQSVQDMAAMMPMGMSPLDAAAASQLGARRAAQAALTVLQRCADPEMPQQ